MAILSNLKDVKTKCFFKLYIHVSHTLTFSIHTFGSEKWKNYNIMMEYDNRYVATNSGIQANNIWCLPADTYRIYLLMDDCQMIFHLDFFVFHLIIKWLAIWSLILSFIMEDKCAFSSFFCIILMNKTIYLLQIHIHVTKRQWLYWWNFTEWCDFTSILYLHLCHVQNIFLFTTRTKLRLSSDRVQLHGNFGRSLRLDCHTFFAVVVY